MHRILPTWSGCGYPSNIGPGADSTTRGSRLNMYRFIREAAKDVKPNSDTFRGTPRWINPNDAGRYVSVKQVPHGNLAVLIGLEDFGNVTAGRRAVVREVFAVDADFHCVVSDVSPRFTFALYDYS